MQFGLHNLKAKHSRASEERWTDVEGMRTARLLDYDTRKFPFAAWLAAVVFKVPSLERLHENWQKHKIARGQSGTLGYDDNLRLRALMQNLDDNSPFYTLYHGFVSNVIASAFGRKISYSSHPKMRVHLAGTSSVSKWHRDVDVTGREDQLNVWLPFTNTEGNNTLWVENDYEGGDHRPIAVPYGKALIFDGGYLSHGTVENDTEVTRVSLDFRFSIVGSDMPDNARAVFDGRPPSCQINNRKEQKESPYY